MSTKAESDSSNRSPGGRLFWGLLERRTCVVPTLRGLLTLLVMAIIGLAVFIPGIYWFLAVTKPVNAEVLVVEGWMPDYGLQTTIEIFKNGHYKQLCVTGGPIEQGAPLSEYHTVAELGAASISSMGMDTNFLRAVPAPEAFRDRTFASALALKKWLQEHGGIPAGLNVVSLGPHARRTRLLYQEAFGKSSKIGVISLTDRSYKGRHWWATSRGFRSTTDELIAYMYARFLFSPPEN